MKSISTFVGAAGAGQWVPTDYRQPEFALSLAVFIESGSTINVKVQIAFDSTSNNRRQVSFSRTTTTVTVADPGHNLATGDSIIVQGTGASNLDGAFDITVVNANSYTYTVTDAGPAAGVAQLASLRVFDHATLTNLTARANGNVAFPITAVRLFANSFSAGRAELIVNQGAQS